MTITSRWKPYVDQIPGTQKILDASVANLGIVELSKLDARKGFGDILENLMAEGLRLLRMHQDEQRKAFFREVLSSELPTLPNEIERELVKGGAPRAVAERIVELTGANVSALPGEFFSVPQQSIGQQTKKRAGVQMERAMAFLFERAGLPFEQQKPKKSDFVFPDMNTWEIKPELAVLVSAKHTLAERWKQLTAERHETGRNAFLATLDVLPQDKASKLVSHGFTLYLLPRSLNALQPNPRLRDLNDLPSRIAEVVNVP